MDQLKALRNSDRANNLMKHFCIPEISGCCPLWQPRQNVLVTLHQILTSPSADMVKLGVKIEVQVEPKN